MRISDWSSDVCSSDLNLRGAFALRKTKVLLGLVVVLIAGTVAAMALRGGKGPESRLAPAPNVAAVTGGREQANHRCWTRRSGGMTGVRPQRRTAEVRGG